ncbi:hypothetical protein HT737_22280 [Pseudomonas sp. MD195_PC81_125]|nr:hypothetical protein [Pseudomonas sp. MD195_PC81_125]MBA5982404.1 hypothetical protein [Pseudomonas sp. MD195_PC81_125]
MHDLNEKAAERSAQGLRAGHAVGKNPEKAEKENRKSVDLPLHPLMQVSYFPAFILCVDRT